MSDVFGHVVGTFFDHWSEVEPQGGDESGPLASYLQDWLEDGHAGFYAVGGDYQIYLRAVLYIIHHLMKDPTLLDYKKGGKVIRRRITGIFEVMDRFAELEVSPSSDQRLLGGGDLDPESFQTALFEHNLKMHLG